MPEQMKIQWQKILGRIFAKTRMFGGIGCVDGYSPSA
ncbi:hypothetical protein CGSHiR3021_05854 [Haemophilus influenzae 22.4-21]|uniref:Uncharacterized protein n=1 Tax=Haemophilus influenzae 22.4-21 TaxID=375063 RepID=A4NY38_HAEIF|nr:hypothetical protein CGSHiR3021_05854 [Haemophilus influenzae 22.4-21]